MASTVELKTKREKLGPFEADTPEEVSRHWTPMLTKLKELGIKGEVTTKKDPKSGRLVTMLRWNTISVTSPINRIQ